MAGMPRNAQDRRTGAERLFAVLDAFDLDDMPVLGASEIARRAQLPVSTAHRLAEQCVAWGGLERAPGGGYQVGVKLWLLGLHSNRIPLVRQAAAPALEQLHEATGLQAQIGVRDARTALCLRFLPNRDVVGERAWLGWNVPLHCTGVGLVLLAHAEPEVADALLGGALRRFTPRTMTDPDELRVRLAEVRRAGVARTGEEYMIGADSIAVPIRDQGGHVTAALSMIIPSDGAPRSFEELVVQAGRAISAELGWTD